MDKLSGLEIPDSHQSPAFERVMLTVVKGGGILFAGKVLLSASRLITAILLARLLSVEQFGLYSLAISASGIIVGISLLGLEVAQVRFVAIAASRKDEVGLWGAFQIGIGLTTLLSVITSTGLFAIAYPIAANFFHEPRLAPLLQFACLIVPFLVSNEVLGGTTRGLKNMHHAVIAQDIFQPLIRLILIVILGIAGLTARQAIIIFGISGGISALLLLIFLNKQFSLRRPIGVDLRNVRKMLTFSLPLWLSNLMVTFRNNLEAILLGSLNTITNVGIFRAVSQVNLLGEMVYSSIINSARPTIAELHDRGDREQLGQMYQTVTKWIMTLNLPVFLIIVLFPEPILSVFGKSFVNGASALAIMAWASFVNSGTGMCSSIIDMTGYSKLKLLNTLVRLVSSLVLNIFLIPRWGIMGAAITALIVEIVVNFLAILEVWILFRLLPYKNGILTPMLAGMAAFTAVYLINHLSAWRENPLWLVVSLLVMFSVYIGVILGLGLDPEDRMLLSHLQKRAKSIITSS